MPDDKLNSTPEHITALRAYFRQWMAGPWQGPEIDKLRSDVDGLTSRAAVELGLDVATDEGLDPL